jgi:hypothetical protein
MDDPKESIDLEAVKKALAHVPPLTVTAEAETWVDVACYLLLALCHPNLSPRQESCRRMRSFVCDLQSRLPREARELIATGFGSDLEDDKEARESGE